MLATHTFSVSIKILSGYNEQIQPDVSLAKKLKFSDRAIVQIQIFRLHLPFIHFSFRVSRFRTLFSDDEKM